MRRAHWHWPKACDQGNAPAPLCALCVVRVGEVDGHLARAGCTAWPAFLKMRVSVGALARSPEVKIESASPVAPAQPVWPMRCT